MTHGLTPRFWRPGALLLLAVLLVSSLRAEGLPAAYQHLSVEDCRTSIYIGSVGMRLGAFEYKDGHYQAYYQARVIPFIFYNEEGSLTVDFDEQQLARLQAGERVDFEGQGRNRKGETRRISGTAMPEGPKAGKIKVRVWVSKNIQLIFNTRYSFSPAPELHH
jgi:hypothetical protein